MILVGESNRLTMRVINLCYLSMSGDHSNFKIQQEALQQAVAKTVVEQTVAAPDLFVWGSSAYFSIGQPQEALELLERGSGVTATTDHMHSQLLQWKKLQNLLMLLDNADYLKKVINSYLKVQLQ